MQRIAVKKKSREDIIESKLKKKDRNGTEFSRLFWFFPREDKLAFASISFCTRCCLIIFWREIQKEYLLKFLPKLLPGETLCKLVQIFPPKVLIYIRKKFLDPFLIGLIEITYLIKENVKEIYSLLKEKPFVAYWVRDNKEIKAYSLFFIEMFTKSRR